MSLPVTPCRGCGNPVHVREINCVWPFVGSERQWDDPRYYHPACLAREDAALRRACAHPGTKVGEVCANLKCGLRVLAGERVGGPS